jgi:hypothetical protein
MGAKMQAAQSDDVATAGEQYVEPEWMAAMRRSHPNLAEIAEQHGRMIEQAILSGNRAHALRIVDRAFETLEDDRIGEGSPVAAILGNQIAVMLERANINSIEQLCKRSRNDLLAIKYVSWGIVKKIIIALQKRGYDLRK